MSHDINDDPLKQLEAALSVKPSPEFAARVRERVRQEPAKSSWGWWSLAAASVAIAVVGVGTVTLMEGQVFKPARVVQTPTAIAKAGSAAFADGAPASPAEAQRRREDPAHHSVAPVTTRPVVVLASTRPHEPEVLVPPDEGIAIRRLLLAIREGRASVPAQGMRVMEDAEGHLLDPTPIDIPLIKIELLPGTPVEGSGGTVK